MKNALSEEKKDGPKSLLAGIAMNRVGTEFVSTIAACGFIGWLVDREAGSQPWVMLAMVFLGFFWGFVKITKMLTEDSLSQKSGEKELK